MTLERQVELLLLSRIMEASGVNPYDDDLPDTLEAENGKVYNLKALSKRGKELDEEFLQPYVIDNAPKGD